MRNHHSTHLTSKLGLFTLVMVGLYVWMNYYPLISMAGISVDDWGDIAHNLECSSYWHCYGTWFPLFSNRPLAPLPITLLTFGLGTWYSGYLLINSFIYIAAIGICANVIRSISNLGSALVFGIFAVIPMIAMPVITSPINQSTATTSFFLWSLSLWTLLKFLHSARVKYWFWTYFLLLLAFLTYEIILPLLVLTAFLPWMVDSKKFPLFSLGNAFRYSLQFLVPLLLVLAITVLWQKGIAPNFIEVDSRLKFNPQHILAKLHTFFHVFYKQIPGLFFKLPNYIDLSHIFSALIALTIIFLVIYFHKPKESYSTKLWHFFTIATLTLFASSLIFILSDESAVSGGYQARGLSSTWIAFAIFLAAIYPQQRTLQIVWGAFLGVFLFLCTLSFSVQRDQTIAAWKMQNMILNNANDLLRAQHLPPNPVILGDIPQFLPNNYNDEIIFSQPWDFGAALAITNTQPIIAGPVIDSSRQQLRQLQIENGHVTAINFAGANLDNFWIYQFNQKQNQGVLFRISNPYEFEKFLAGIRKKDE